MIYLESIFKVLVVGLILGAGLPAVFAAGLVAFSNGAGGTHEDGTVVAPNPVLKAFGLVLFGLVAAVIVIAILWITKTTIIHHFGFNPVPFIPGK
ncbi:MULTISPECIES: hypothetical protein [Mycolicibacterium]|jgi:hypothetical protein|uniref:Transmembrane protein n=3 Tax=Mycolicibacterium TaxID=1866885 RepID=A0A378W5N9_9MYCO|nr:MULTISPECIES: hypothetical protein [Mycolicibacterium]KLI05108.1 hypothetical protein AA982_26755 [Mycolicibacterium senegalense]KLO52041.1 hypothetical protein ABW05_11440 [Mycolicibacterium senegalense]KMV15688.1 hypothetical protein ACT17_24445 [Mycolicibacterium conceptionense]MCV7335460.1 hypothetical protein [Mycolicibacterium senegalense]MCW1822495.1 hypothetical protein [Mycolicibacterium senegalense]